MKTKNLGTYLLFAILGGIITWSILNQPIVEVDIKSYELKIQLLESKIDSVRSINNVLKQEADSLTTKLTTKIYVIKKQTQVKLDAVDNFGDDELERFFADRYRQSKDSIN